MKKWHVLATTICLLGLVACSTLIMRSMRPVSDSDIKTDRGKTVRNNELISIARGGQLYDNWWRATTTTSKPEGDHLLWKEQTTNQRSGYSTYRCKECHGWDYQGKDGAYREGSHYTGFMGVLDASNRFTLSELEGVLKGITHADHDFSTILSSKDISDLALFLKKGTIDTSGFINHDGSIALANPDLGAKLYENNCTHRCHGHYGTIINFGDKKKPEYVGTIARKNPWEFIHKVRAGQPGTRMPSSIISHWQQNDILNLLAYARTLPADDSKPELSRHRMSWLSSDYNVRGFGPSSD